ncbi:MAG: GNAT family N-acetyltransferase [Betaproteobacteria bacterium]
MFVTASVAARIEREESLTAVGMAEVARARGDAVLIEPIGGGAAVFGGPDQPFNKLAGLGFAEPLDEVALGRIERDFDARHAPLRVELSTLAEPGTAAALTRRGYVLIGFENVLGMTLTGERTAAIAREVERDRPSGVVVTRVSEADVPVWVETLAEGFGHPDTFDGPPPTESFERATIERVLLDCSRAPGYVLYLATRDRRVAGGGSIRMSDGLVQLTGAATLPADRRRGVQSALLRARLLDAARAGCDLAVVTTEPASKSQENVQRAGFSLLYARAILVRAPG